jgi:protein TonB
MSLRCLLFSSDEGTAEPICQALAGLGVEAEYCSEARAAIEKVGSQSYQIVIIDWDKQPEAGELLTTARQRKAAERPLTLAIVSDDNSVPKALQAGANSILRKPLLANHVRDTLATARDLLRARQESATAMAHAAAAGTSLTASTQAPPIPAPASLQPATAGNVKERTLRAGEFLNAAPSAPGSEFVIESGANSSLHSPSIEFVKPLHDLESFAASVTDEETEEEKPASIPAAAFSRSQIAGASPAFSASATPVAGSPVSSSPPDGARGLDWYLKTRAGASAATVATERGPVPATSAKSDLLGFDQMASPSSSFPSSASSPSTLPATQSEPEDSPEESVSEQESKPFSVPAVVAKDRNSQERQEQKKEAELFAYMDGKTVEGKTVDRKSGESAEVARPKSKLGKGAFAVAIVLAGCAIAAAPQAPWHSQMRTLLIRGKQSMHGWLNPQPVTPVQAPAAHEDFGRAGDEYKMPVEENIPDATTDPSQIQVVPMVDPTAKKPPSDANQQPPAAPADGAGATNGQSPGIPQTSSAAPSGPATGGAPSSAPASVSAPLAAPAVPNQTVPSGPIASGTAPVQVAPVKNHPVVDTTPATNVPSSLKSQIASMTPDASGNRAPETAMDSIEPVAVSEASERALLADQPAIDYPANAKGQQGTVMLQVLVARDGTVQDAKFQQGSLAFARAAIDGVKQWKFKPYIMNGRAVSVQTVMTMSFKPAP